MAMKSMPTAYRLWGFVVGVDTLAPTAQGPIAPPSGMQTTSYARHSFSPDVIRHAGWLYLRFTLSYRHVEDLSAERQQTAPDES